MLSYGGTRPRGCSGQHGLGEGIPAPLLRAGVNSFFEKATDNLCFLDEEVPASPQLLTRGARWGWAARAGGWSTALEAV